MENIPLIYGDHSINIWRSSHYYIGIRALIAYKQIHIHFIWQPYLGEVPSIQKGESHGLINI